LKLETYLRLAGIEFEVVVGQHTGVAPRVRVVPRCQRWLPRSH
jgi:hypothetical protein